MNDNEIIEIRRRKHDENEIQYGCGYYSVCDEAGFCCPCSPTAKVSQGFDNDVWLEMKHSMER